MIKVFTEGSSTFGFGHLIRCLTIVNYCNSNGIEVKFIVDGDSTSLDFISKNNGLLVNWKSNDFLESELSNEDIVIVDSYYIELIHIETIKRKSKRCIVIDDHNRLDYRDCIILNPNFCSAMLNFDYKKNKYLIGSDYVLLRSQFTNKKFIYKNRDVKQILITLGGSDILNLTPRLIEYFNSKYFNVKLDIVIGFGYNNVSEIRVKCNKNTTLHYDVDANKMVDLMLNSDFVVSAAGQTLNEIIKLGCPACFIKVIDNQLINIDYLEMSNYGEIFCENDFSNIDNLFKNDFREKLSGKLAHIDNSKTGASNLFEYLKKEMDLDE